MSTQYEVKRIPLALSTKCQSGARRRAGRINPLYFSPRIGSDIRVTEGLASLYYRSVMPGQIRALSERGHWNKTHARISIIWHTISTLIAGRESVRLPSIRHTAILRSEGGRKFSADCISQKFHTLRRLNYNCEFHFGKWLVSWASISRGWVSDLEFTPDPLSNPKSLCCVIDGEKKTKGLCNPKD